MRVTCSDRRNLGIVCVGRDGTFACKAVSKGSVVTLTLKLGCA